MCVEKRKPEPSTVWASSNSKIFIFPIGPECWHQALLLFLHIFRNEHNLQHDGRPPRGRPSSEIEHVTKNANKKQKNFVSESFGLEEHVKKLFSIFSSKSWFFFILTFHLDTFVQKFLYKGVRVDSQNLKKSTFWQKNWK